MSDTAYVSILPDCDIHKYDLGRAGVPAAYDKRTPGGQWANVCEACFKNSTDGRLGTGHGQRLVVGEPPERNVQAEVLTAIHAGDMDAAWEAIGDGDPADFF